MITDTQLINRKIEAHAKTALTKKEILEQQIKNWLSSKARKTMLTGEKYYRGEHDILQRKRTVIGKSGRLEPVENLPNNRTVHNQYAKMVDQKTNYFVGQVLTLDTESAEYQEALSELFDKRFHKLLRSMGTDSLNCGLAWLYVYYDEQSELAFRRFSPWEIIPSWKDAEHTDLEYAIRIYEVIEYEGTEEKIKKKVEVYTLKGIEYYDWDDKEERLITDSLNPFSHYASIVVNNSAEDRRGTVEQGVHWERLPLIPFKHNSKEIPLIVKVKNLQDSLNLMMSDFQNAMQEDGQSSILVLKNYDGEDLGTFRHNLMQYRAVKVKSFDGQSGGLDSIHIEVNAKNYESIVDMFKKAIIENAMGYDAKDDRMMGGSPNQMNIQSMYSDIDLDANGMETEYQAAMESLLWFVNNYLATKGKGDFENEKIDFIFNRDIMINESEIIANCLNSTALISKETAISNHPWISDVEKEMKRIEAERVREEDAYPTDWSSTKEEDEPDKRGE
ncbi:MAG: phage portal protein [Bacillota bacterium]|jgi:SPP1 family phage portal protein